MGMVYVPSVEGEVTRAHVLATRVMRAAIVNGEWSAVSTSTPPPSPTASDRETVSLYMQDPRLQ